MVDALAHELEKGPADVDGVDGLSDDDEDEPYQPEGEAGPDGESEVA